MKLRLGSRAPARPRTLTSIVAALTTALAATLLGVVTFPASPARAASAPPAVSAWYMYGTSLSTLESNAKSHGCYFAQNHPATGDQPMILDFGAARMVGTSAGAIDFSNTTFANGKIYDALVAAAQGVHNCYTQGHIVIVYGNSNYHMSNVGMTNTNAYDVGLWQEGRAASLRSYQSNHGYVNQTAAAGSDIEPSWDTQFISNELVKGATAANHYVYYDYGSADGCPTTGTGGNCNNGWDVAEVAFASHHGKARPLPEIYEGALTTMAAQWTVIRKNWDNNNSSTYKFAGVTGSPGYAQAGWNALEADNPNLVYRNLACFGC